MTSLLEQLPKIVTDGKREAERIMERLDTMNLIKSKQRVADHGEVFAPEWMVEAMLDLVKGETVRIFSSVSLQRVLVNV